MIAEFKLHDAPRMGDTGENYRKRRSSHLLGVLGFFCHFIPQVIFLSSISVLESASVLGDDCQTTRSSVKNLWKGVSRA